MNLEAKKIFFEKIIELFKKKTITKIVYNLKQQLLAYSNESFPIFDNVFDVQIAAYLLNKKIMIYSMRKIKTYKKYLKLICSVKK
jgi:DNA polymerase I-like protein with 3'-5' exonuclease and polymerase domains